MSNTSKAKTVAEINSYLAQQSKLPNSVVRKLTCSLADLIVRELKSNGQFNLFGLGKIVVRNAKARTGINPTTGKKINIPASKRVALKAGKALKSAVNR